MKITAFRMVKATLSIPAMVLISSHVAAQPGHEHAPSATEPTTAAQTPTIMEPPQRSAGNDAAMDHQAMQMQGGRPTANARETHAYSNGYTLTEGPYALPGPRQLVLADEHRFWAVLGDRVEYDDDSSTGVYDVQAWYGTTYSRLTAKLEGDVTDGRLEESQSELLWSRAFSAYFDAQLGVRFDQYDEGNNREWLAVGVQGLAPYWFEVDLTAYVGDRGRTALSLEAEYDLLLSQRLILQPRTEINAYGKRDAANGIGDGLSDIALGMRLRYEFSRQFAPYVGVEWSRKFGDTADFARAADEAVRDTVYVMGVRFWF